MILSLLFLLPRITFRSIVLFNLTSRSDNEDVAALLYSNIIIIIIISKIIVLSYLVSMY